MAKRVDAQRVYVLQRGGIWFYNGNINNLGWDLNIKAEEGNRSRFLLFMVLFATGSSAVPKHFYSSRRKCNIKKIL